MFWCAGKPKIKVGESFLELGSKVVEMKDATPLLGDVSKLREGFCSLSRFTTHSFCSLHRSFFRVLALSTDGYLLLRGLLDKTSVLNARKVVIDCLDKVRTFFLFLRLSVSASSSAFRHVIVRIGMSSIRNLATPTRLASKRRRRVCCSRAIVPSRITNRSWLFSMVFSFICLVCTV
jgi:hypothetical protein